MLPVLKMNTAGAASAARFALLGVASSLGISGVLRLSWVESQVLLPLTQAQGGIAAPLFGTSAMAVEVTLACSGADVLALCLGAILAYPVGWRSRIAAASGGAGVILGLNTMRIGTLGLAAASPTWFTALHLYVWPAVLTLAVAGYVFAWMRIADRRTTPNVQPPVSPRDPVRVPALLTRRFVMFALAFLILFVAASPLYLQSPQVLALAGFIARTAAGILRTVGVDAQAAGHMLLAPRGSFVVTQECISTPLIPIYLAAVCVYARTRLGAALGVLAAAPLFVALGIARVLVVALPVSLVASPLFLVHAFYQLLLGAVLVAMAALWRHGGRAAAAPALFALAAGGAFVVLAGPWYSAVVSRAAAGPLEDPQGALALLPGYQMGLYLALSIAAFAALEFRRFAAGLAVLGMTQAAGLLALHALSSHAGVTAHVRDVRAWAVAGPVLVLVAVLNLARARR